MSDTLIYSPAEAPAQVSSELGSSGVILLGAEAILILLLTYVLVEWGSHMTRKLKETDTPPSLTSIKLKFAFPALAISVLPTLLAACYIRMRLFDYSGDILVSAWILLGVLTVGFLIQAALMIIFFKKAERIFASKNQTSSTAETETTEKAGSTEELHY